MIVFALITRQKAGRRTHYYRDVMRTLQEPFLHVKSLKASVDSFYLRNGDFFSYEIDVTL